MNDRDLLSNAQAILMEARAKGDTKMTLADAKKKAREWAAKREKADLKAKKTTAKKKK